MALKWPLPSRPLNKFQEVVLTRLEKSAVCRPTVQSLNVPMISVTDMMSLPFLKPAKKGCYRLFCSSDVISSVPLTSLTIT